MELKVQVRKMNQRKRLDPEIRQNLINDYLMNDFSITKLSKIYNISVYKIIREFRESNIKIENKAIIPKITDELGKDLISKYKNGNSLSKLSKIYNISITVISKYFKRNGITIINRQNQCKFNQSIFDNIDTDEKAYWLGFIFADGYISSTRYSFELSLSIKDRDHLERFNDFMEYSGDNIKVSPATFRNKQFIRCRWSIVNKHLWNTLNNLGCIPNKYTKLDFQKTLPKKYIPSFIRGYFDGDGCITGTPISINTTILGTDSFLNGIINYFKTLDNDFKYSMLVDKRMSMTKVLRIHKKSIKLFFDVIYKNNTICLIRKYNRFIDLLKIAVPLRN